MTAVGGLESAWLEYFARAVAADLGALKNRDEVMFRDGAHPRFLERINVLHESIAFRLAIEAFLVRQLRSGRHAGKSNLKRRHLCRQLPGKRTGTPSLALNATTINRSPLTW
jgi:hypothetical protein